MRCWILREDIKWEWRDIMPSRYYENVTTYLSFKQVHDHDDYLVTFFNMVSARTKDDKTIWEDIIRA